MVGLDSLSYPVQLGVEVVKGARALLVAPVGGDSVLRKGVHLPGAYLHFELFTVRADHSGVQRLVHVGLGVGYVVVELAGDRLPYSVDYPQHGVAGRDVVHKDPESKQVVQLLHGQFFSVHLLVDAVEVLGPPLDLAADPLLLQPGCEYGERLLDNRLPLGEFSPHPSPYLVVHLRVGVFEGKVFEAALDLIDAKAVRQRGVDLQGLARYAHLLVLPQSAEGAHVVKPVGKLYQDHADVLGHYDEHLAQILRLIVLECLEWQLAELCHPVDQGGHGRAESGRQLLYGDLRVLQYVVQQGGREGDAVELHVGQYGGDVYRVDDVRISRGAALLPVGCARHHQGLAELHQLFF